MSVQTPRGECRACRSADRASCVVRYAEACFLCTLGAEGAWPVRTWRQLLTVLSLISNDARDLGVELFDTLTLLRIHKPGFIKPRRFHVIMPFQPKTAPSSDSSLSVAAMLRLFCRIPGLASDCGSVKMVRKEGSSTLKSKSSSSSSSETVCRAGLV